MNGKQFAILLILLAALGGGAWFLNRGHELPASPGGQRSGGKLMGEKFPINDVAHILIRQGTNELNLVKKNDLWRLRERNDYPANFTSISETLIKLGDLKIIQTEDIGPSQLPRLQLVTSGQSTNPGTTVDFKDKDEKTLGSLVLGKKHLAKPTAQQKQFGMGEEGFPDGRYVQKAGDTGHVLVVSDALGSLEPKPEDWLNKDFFKVERPKSIAVDFPSATNSWKLVRDTDSGEWKMDHAKPEEKLDAARVSGVTSPFVSASFDDLQLPGAGGTNLEKPTVITIATFDDFIFTIKLGEKNGQDYPLTVSVVSDSPKERIPAKDEKPEDKDKADKAWQVRQKELDQKLKDAKRFEGWTFLVPNWNVDPILKERKDLLEEKKEEPNPAPPEPLNLDTNSVPAEAK